MKTLLLSGMLCAASAMAVAADSRGKALYLENCAACHGAHGEGASAPKLAGDASNWPGRLFARAVLSGIDDHGKPLQLTMPHWGDTGLKADRGQKPTRAEIDAIQRYLKAPE